MSLGFLITTFEETDLKIDVEDFTTKLLNRWKGSQVHHEEDSTNGYLLHFSIELGTIDSPIRGGIQDNRNTISLRGYAESCAEFAVWYRSLIPVKYRLYFCDGAFNSYAELQIGSSVDKVIEEYEKDYGKKLDPWFNH
jgi:hypothetical protein